MARLEWLPTVRRGEGKAHKAFVHGLRDDPLCGEIDLIFTVDQEVGDSNSPSGTTPLAADRTSPSE